jgi:hypothetical protein
MEKHAFLIMAHSNPDQLRTLLTLLDHPRLDIFLHIDRKADYSGEDFASVLKHSRLFSVDRQRIGWGGLSQIRCEFTMLEAALPGQYAYYHLISGLDLPLRPMEEFFSFFDSHAGTEFVSVQSRELNEDEIDKFSRYWFFQEYERIHGIFYRLNHGLVRLQKALGIDRHKKDSLPIYKGANWFSCTHDFCSDLLKQKTAVLKRYRFTRCCDEMFLQTYLMNSSHREHLFDFEKEGLPSRNLRAIDWERGTPYTYRKEDVPQLLKSGAFFGRKFDQNVDGEAIKAVASVLLPIE